MIDQLDLQYEYNEQQARKVRESLYILTLLDFPRAQLNDRSALTLLALLDLKPNLSWAESTMPLMGIRPIMDWSRDHYGVTYAENSRETFRRQTIHQFVDAALAVCNPDDFCRPVNSPKTCYQIESKAFRLLCSFGTDRWDNELAIYTRERAGLRVHYAKQREMHKLPLQIAEGTEITITPGVHSKLIKAIVDEFGPRFAPSGQVLYVGDTGEKWGIST